VIEEEMSSIPPDLDLYEGSDYIFFPRAEIVRLTQEVLMEYFLASVGYLSVYMPIMTTLSPDIQTKYFLITHFPYPIFVGIPLSLPLIQVF